MQIIKLNHHDTSRFMEVIRLFEHVFEMKNFKMPPEDHLKQLLEKPEFHVFAALNEEKVIGGLTAYTLEQYYATKPLAYIYDLAINQSFQRKGIGGELIEAFKSFCQKEGFEEVFVQADRIDQHAVDFYRKTNPTEEEDVLHFYYTL